MGETPKVSVSVTILNRMGKKYLTKQGHLNSAWRRSGSKLSICGKAALQATKRVQRL